MCQQDSERIFPIFLMRYEWPYFLGRRDRRGKCIQRIAGSIGTDTTKKKMYRKYSRGEEGMRGETSAANRALFMGKLDPVLF